MPLSLLSVIVNATILVVVIILVFILLNAGSRHRVAIGEAGIQREYQFTILRAIVGIIVLSLVAAIYNLFFR